MGQGKRQIYGSQIARDQETNVYYVSPLEDPDHVDQRSAEAGPGPLADNVNRWQSKWDREQYKKDLPTLEEKIIQGPINRKEKAVEQGIDTEAKTAIEKEEKKGPEDRAEKIPEPPIFETPKAKENEDDLPYYKSGAYMPFMDYLEELLNEKDISKAFLVFNKAGQVIDLNWLNIRKKLGL